ncbi:MAG: 30S ribosomal protein S6 [Arcobacter sp.]|nr:MAG: 30S ribosomal protein S6 [Arcobacter sp.]
MRHYENLVILKPTLTAEEMQAAVAQIEENITKDGGEIVVRDVKGMKRLAYEINKNARGYFHIMYFRIEPTAIAEIERLYRINEDVLRFVTVKYQSKREIKAWSELVNKTEKATEARAAAAARAAAPKVEAAAPVKTETPAETPAATEAPAATETPATDA